MTGGGSAAGEAPVLLIGPRAAGKTTLGRRLAEHLGWEFLDADEVLEQRHGRSIREWLPRDPAGFRRAEAALLRELAGRPRLVAALGGGVVEDPGSRRLLAAQPRVLALAAPAEVLAARQAGSERPPLSTLPLREEVAAVLARRRAGYAEASRGRCVDTSGSEEEAWALVLEAWQSMKG